MLRRIGYSNEELIDAIKQGGRAEDKAIRYLVNKYWRQLISYFLKLGGNSSDADDHVQDVLTAFVKAVRHNKLSDDQKLNGFLYGICRNLWLKKLRTKTSKKEYLSDTVPEGVDEDYPDLTLLERDKEQAVKKVMDMMKPKCLDLHRLRNGESMKWQLIADQLGYTEAKSATRAWKNCLKDILGAINMNPALKSLLNG